MRLRHEFVVDLELDDAWETLSDLRFVASCLPGARIDSESDGVFAGTLATKVGPIATSFNGTAQFVELDRADHRAVIEAGGRDRLGAGAVTATITAQADRLGPTSTNVQLETDLAITGRVAQFARGGLSEISEMMLDQFAENLSAAIASPNTVRQAAGAEVLDVGRSVAAQRLLITGLAGLATATVLAFLVRLRRGRVS
jgi:carbon monoxide dehydrogenase subunit G